jgi:hypothetical protein
LLSAPDLPSLTPGGFSAKCVHAAIAVHAAAAAAAAAAASMAQRISLAAVPHRIARMQIRYCYGSERGFYFSALLALEIERKREGKAPYRSFSLKAPLQSQRA